jgi:glycosyltransferase involved in cell wall biosynthesis
MEVGISPQMPEWQRARGQERSDEGDAALRLLAFTKSASDPASRFRLKQWIPYLQAAGWSIAHRPNRPDLLWQSPFRHRAPRALHARAGRLWMKVNRLRDLQDAGRFDAVFVNRDLAGGGLFFEKRLRQRNPRVLFDFDDAIFVGRNEPAVRWMCANAAWVTPGNEHLRAYAARFTDRLCVIPTVIDTDRYLPRPRPLNGRIRVGWSGSDQSIHATLRPYLPLLARTQRDADFDLVVITNTRPAIAEPGLRWSFLPWSEASEVEGLQTLDIGLMPLIDDAFQRGKCGLKLLQYMAVGIPAIASPVGVNRAIVVPDQTGLLAARAEEWRETLMALIRDADLRARMGAAARERCEQYYSMRRWGPVLLAVLDRVARGGAPREMCAVRSPR